MTTYRFFGVHIKHIATKLITTKHITHILSKQNLSTTKLIKLQNVSHSKPINKIHESKISNRGNVPKIV